jgi:hypothetical protein
MKYYLPIVLWMLGLVVLPAIEEDAQKPMGERTFRITLQSPISTRFTLPRWPQSKAFRLQARLFLPEGVPDDLGYGLWLSNNDGHWQQTIPQLQLQPGINQLDVAINANTWFQGQGQHMPWSASQLAESVRGGLFFWSEKVSNDIITLDQIRISPLAQAPQLSSLRLVGLSYSDHDQDGSWHSQTGKRSVLRFSPEESPENPYNPRLFKADLILSDEASGGTQEIPAFYIEPQSLINRGDREISQAAGPGHFAVRIRPQRAGTYSLHLRATWQENSATPQTRLFQLPSLTVSGADWDDYVRVDGQDSRFFAINGKMYWPIGINIRSINDLRGAKQTRSQLTPDFGTESYEAYFKRLAAAGGNAVEVWLANWNLAMEWRGDWPEFRGLGRYSQARAARLDKVLDSAYQHGIRVNLVIRNHGQASARTNSEWKDSPYNILNGGIIEHPKKFFTDPEALALQQAFHRYVIGRFGDHPAILGWKLFSEVNLTAGRGKPLIEWHRNTAQFIARLDNYDHPISSHWSGDYRTPNRKIVALDALTYVCIDAYHGRKSKKKSRKGRTIVDIMWDSTQSPAPGRGLMQFGKPVLVTEYGGSAWAAPVPQLLAEHCSAPWTSFVAGHAGSPMLWWFEWVDQNDLWAPYHALARFTKGEDLRGSTTTAHKLLSSADNTWAGAWGNSARLLGYIVNRQWSFDGSELDKSLQTKVKIPAELLNKKSAQIGIEWWNADTGERIKSSVITNPHAPFSLETPPFVRHLAFKFYAINEVL